MHYNGIIGEHFLLCDLKYTLKRFVEECRMYRTQLMRIPIQCKAI